MWPAEPAERGAASAPAVAVVAAIKQDIKPHVTFSGRVTARDKVDVRARVEGFLQKRLFTEGQDVKEGDLLFVIEQEQYKASVDEIKASIVKAKAALTLADIEVTARRNWSRVRPGPNNGSTKPTPRRRTRAARSHAWRRPWKGQSSSSATQKFAHPSPVVSVVRS